MSLLWNFVLAVPAPVRMLMSIVLTVGITLVLVRVLRPQLLTVVARGRGAATDHPGVSQPGDILGRLASLTIVGFIFLSGLTVSQFWTNGRIATQATSAESAAYLQATAYADMIPAEQGGQQISRALQDYKASVTDVQWPLLEHADAVAVSDAQVSAAREVRLTMLDAVATGATGSPVWGDLSTAVDDMLMAGVDRIDSVPQSNALMLLILIGFLAIVNLVALALVSPTYLGLNMLVMGVAALITGVLVFFVVEAANPFIAGEYSMLTLMP